MTKKKNLNIHVYDLTEEEAAPILKVIRDLKKKKIEHDPVYLEYHVIETGDPDQFIGDPNK